MKTRKNLALFVAICSVVALYSCKGGSNTSLFAKKWQFDSFKSKAYDDQLAMIQKAADTAKDSATKASLQQQLKMYQSSMDAMKKSVLTCNVDGTCEMSMSMMGQTKTSKGKWTLIADGKKVVMSDDQSAKADTLNVDELTADHMTVSGSDGKGGTMSMTYKSVQ